MDNITLPPGDRERMTELKAIASELELENANLVYLNSVLQKAIDMIVGFLEE